MTDKSTLCLWIDGVGLSPSWSGNAFMSASPKNFLDNWSKYKNAIVNSSLNFESKVENKEIDFARVNGGEDYLSDKKFLDKHLKEGGLNDNAGLEKIIEEAKTRNSAIHLVGNLPSPSEAYSSLKHLGELLKQLDKDIKTQIYVHLILGDDHSDKDILSNCISNYQELIEKFPTAETASISGQNFLKDNQVKHILETVLLGKGSPALTLEQAFSLHGKQAPDKPPTSILYRDKFAFRAKNFDTVIFFNHNLKHFKSFIQPLKAELIGSLSLPKFLLLGSFYDPSFNESNSLIPFFKREFSDNLLSVLNGHYNLNIITDEDGIDNMKYSINPSDYKIIQFDNYKILTDNLPTLLGEKNSFNLVYLNLCSLINVYKDAELSVKKFDNFLGEAIKYKDDINLIVFSSKAGLERLTNRNIYEKVSEKTIAPLPFLLINDNSKKFFSSKMIFYDMIKKKQSLIDIAPTILDILGIENRGTFHGNSFLKELK